MDDNSLMPYGVHAGKKMIDVPSGYLLWLYEQNKCSGEVKAYIYENINVIKHEVKQNGQQR